jgi:hypothetical protein
LLKIISVSHIQNARIHSENAKEFAAAKFQTLDNGTVTLNAKIGNQELVSWNKAIYYFVKANDHSVLPELYRARGAIIRKSKKPDLCMLCDEKPTGIGRKIANSHYIPEGVLTRIATRFTSKGKVFNPHSLTYELFCNSPGCEALLSSKGESPFIQQFMDEFLVNLNKKLLNNDDDALTLDYSRWLSHCVASLAFRLLLTDLNNKPSWDSLAVAPLTWELFSDFREFINNDKAPLNFSIRLLIDKDVLTDSHAEPTQRGLVHKLFGWKSENTVDPLILYTIKGATFVIAKTDEIIQRCIDGSNALSIPILNEGTLSLSNNDSPNMFLPRPFNDVIESFLKSELGRDFIPYLSQQKEGAQSASLFEGDANDLFLATQHSKLLGDVFILPSPKIEWIDELDNIEVKPQVFSVLASHVADDGDKSWLLRYEKPKDGYTTALVIKLNSEAGKRVFGYDLKFDKNKWGIAYSLLCKEAFDDVPIDKNMVLKHLCLKPINGTTHELFRYTDLDQENTMLLNELVPLINSLSEFT